MQAVICSKHGAPEDLEIGEVPNPPLRDNEVRIAVRACGVNFPDVLMIAGRYQLQPELPFVPGAELSGVISETGTGVVDLQVGQRVLAMCSYGAMAGVACVDRRSVVPIPDAMSFTDAAGFILTYGTSWHALKQRARLQPGEFVLVLGAAGGVGLAAVELAAAHGAVVAAAASSDDKLALARQYGARHLIDYSSESLKDRIRELTGGRGADVIYDPVGGERFDDCLRSVAWNGRVLVVGFASGDIQKIPANLPLLKGSSIVGVFWGRFVNEEPAAHAANTRELLAMYENGRLKPHVSRVYPLRDAAAAFRCLADRLAMGKVIIEI